jgi:hypothetical protein
MATGYGLDDRGVGVRVPVGSRLLSSPRRPDRLWGPPSFLCNGYRGALSPGVKLTIHLQLVPRSRKRGSIHPLPHAPYLITQRRFLQPQAQVGRDRITPHLTQDGRLKRPERESNHTWTHTSTPKTSSRPHTNEHSNLLTIPNEVRCRI